MFHLFTRATERSSREHLSLRKKFATLLVAVAFLINPLFIPSALAEESLGIGVTVVPDSNPGASAISGNNRLWFGVEQGDSYAREIVVTSATDIDQRVSFVVLDSQIIDGEVSANRDAPGVTSQWVTFEPSVLLLKARSNIRVKMIYSIPNDLADGSFNSYLQVIAEAENFEEVLAAESSSSAVKAIVKGAAAVELPVWLGVGDATELLPDFTLNAIRGVLIDGEKFLRLQVSNTGGTPLGLRGTVELTDRDFAERRFGPFEFRSQEIDVGKTVDVDILVSDEITEGGYRIFVSASQGNITKTMLFEENLTFQPDNPLIWLLFQMLLAVISAIGLVVGIRLIRKSKSTASKELPVATRDSTTKDQTKVKKAAVKRKLAPQPSTKASSIEDPKSAKRTTTKSRTEVSPASKNPKKAGDQKASKAKAQSTSKSTRKTAPPKSPGSKDQAPGAKRSKS